MPEQKYRIPATSANPDADKILWALRHAFAEGEEKVVVEFPTTNLAQPTIAMQLTGVIHASAVPGIYTIFGYVRLERLGRPLTASGFYDANKKEGWVNVGDK